MIKQVDACLAVKLLAKAYWEIDELNPDIGMGFAFGHVIDACKALNVTLTKAEQERIFSEISPRFHR